MVGTRHSLPSTSADDDDKNNAPDNADSPASPAMSKKARAALKKLQIDGTDALAGGEKPQHEDLETYHFRGAVYAVSKGTKKEWVEGEPERYRKRKARRETGSLERQDSGYGRSSDDADSGEGREVDTARRRSGGGRKVRFESTSGGHTGPGSKKRKRSMGDDLEGEEDIQAVQRRRSTGPRKLIHTSSPPRPQSRQARLPAPGGRPLSKRTTASQNHFTQRTSFTSPNTFKALSPPSIRRSTSSKLNTSKSDQPTSKNNNNSSAADNRSEVQRKVDDLRRLASLNEQHIRLKTAMKRVLLLKQIRESRHGDGNQLTHLHDPRQFQPRAQDPQPATTNEDDTGETVDDTAGDDLETTAGEKGDDSASERMYLDEIFGEDKQVDETFDGPTVTTVGGYRIKKPVHSAYDTDTNPVNASDYYLPPPSSYPFRPRRAPSDMARSPEPKDRSPSPRARSPAPTTRTPPVTGRSPPYTLDTNLTNPDRAESAALVARRALDLRPEALSTRRRRTNREIDAVRNLWDEGPVVADVRIPSAAFGVYDGSETALAVPRPGVPEEAPYPYVPDEVRGRMGFFSAAERDEVREAWMGLWSPPAREGRSRGAWEDWVGGWRYREP